MVQGPPSAHLVLGHADFAFGVLESALNPESTGLAFCQIEQSGGRRGVAQSIGSLAVGIFANEEPPSLDAMGRISESCKKG